MGALTEAIEKLRAEREQILARLREIDAELSLVRGDTRSQRGCLAGSSAAVRDALASGPKTHAEIVVATGQREIGCVIGMLASRGAVAVDRTSKPYRYSLAERGR